MKLCCFFNYNPFYRLPIYSAIDNEFDVDFYFNDYIANPPRPFNPQLLKGFKSIIHGRKSHYRSYVISKGIKPIFAKKYTHYLLTGDASFVLNWLILIYGKLCHRKVYLWCHGLNNTDERKTVRLYYSAFYKMAKGIFLYGEHAIPYMKGIGCAEEKLFCIHNSLDTSVQTELFNKLAPSNIYKDHFGNDNPTIIYIGRIQKRKKVNQIIEAVEILKVGGYEVNVAIVGDNMDEPEFEQYVNSSKVSEQVWLFGPSYCEESNAELLYNADVCVSPGNVGLTSIHSLSYGTPVITNDNFETQMPEYSAITPGETGDFFKENSIEDIAEKIKRWTQLDVESREKCRQKSRETVVNLWSIDYQVRLLNEVLR